MGTALLGRGVRLDTGSAGVSAERAGADVESVFPGPSVMISSCGETGGTGFSSGFKAGSGVGALNEGIGAGLPGVSREPTLPSAETGACAIGARGNGREDSLPPNAEGVSSVG